ncbi:MAG: DUF177 domain-containing protein [Syntrophotaleaceae bacterium]
MLIQIERIKAPGLILDLEESPETFPVLREMEEAGECCFPSPVKVHLRAFRLQEMVEVEGQVETIARFPCSRCLNEFDLKVEEGFAVAFTRQLPEVQDEEEEGAELTAEDMGLILFQGDEIDLTDAIQEQVVMALPVRPLCRPECKGLCSQCGADLNLGDCGCDRGDFNIKFSVLKDFKVKKKK